MEPCQHQVSTRENEVPAMFEVPQSCSTNYRPKPQGIFRPGQTLYLPRFFLCPIAGEANLKARGVRGAGVRGAGVKGVCVCVCVCVCSVGWWVWGV